MNSASEELNNFKKILLENKKDFKNYKSNDLAKYFFYIAKEIYSLFSSQNYFYLKSHKQFFEIKLEYFYNNLLKIYIKSQNQEFSISLKHPATPTYKIGVLYSYSFFINKETIFNEKNIILVQSGDKTLTDEFNQPIYSKENVIQDLYEHTGFNVKQNELDDFGYILKENTLFKLYRYLYKNQLIIPTNNIENLYSFKKYDII